MREVMAMVLAGGRGDRLGVLTKHRPTSAMPFGAKYRVIDFVLSNLSHSEISRVGVLTQYAPVSLNRHVGIGRPWDLDRRDGGIRVLQPYVRSRGSTWYAGTADALVQNIGELRAPGARHLLIVSADEVYCMDYGPLLERHVRSGASLTLAVSRRDPLTDTRRVGMLAVDDAGFVRDFVEKPDSSDLSFMFLGMYVFDMRVILERLSATPQPVHLVYDVLLPMLQGGERVAAYEFDGVWQDMGCIADYYTANMDLLSRHPRLPLGNPDWQIYSPSEERPPAKLGRGARIDTSLIAHGARVWGTVANSILSPGVVVEEGAVVSDSIVLHDAVIHRRAQVEGAIIDKGVSVGEAAAIGADDGAWDGGDRLAAVTVIGKNAVIPDALVIGRGCTIDSEVLPDQFTGGAVRSGESVLLAGSDR